MKGAICGVIASIFVTRFCFAADCPVEKFTVQDVERLKFSDALALSAIDVMEASQQSKRDTHFSLGAVIKGAPVNVGFDDMKEVANYLKKNSSYNFSRDQQIDFFRTNVSLLTGDMYKECLKRRTQNFSLEIPSNAYTEDEFLLKIKWTPTYSATEPKAAIIRVLNGTAEGAATAQQNVSPQKTVSFVIRRADRNKSLQLVPTVDGYDNGEDTAIIIPPIVSLNYKTVVRSWPARGEDPYPPICSDDGGGNCGNDAKHVVRCIQASDGGCCCRVRRKSKRPTAVHLRTLLARGNHRVSAGISAHLWVATVLAGRGEFGNF